MRFAKHTDFSRIDKGAYHEPHGVSGPVRLRFALLEERELFTEKKILGSQSGAGAEA